MRYRIIVDMDFSDLSEARLVLRDLESRLLGFPHARTARIMLQETFTFKLEKAVITKFSTIEARTL